MSSRLLKTLPAAVAMALSFGQAYASDAEGEFHGYFRSGAGFNSGHGSQVNFGLGGPTQDNSSGRLGNEPNTYAELQYTKEFAKSSNGASFVGTFMANAYNGSSQYGIGDSKNNSKLGLNQYFVEAKKVPFLNGGTAWVGNRFYNRPDIHMLDLQYVNMSGVGAGIDALPAGPGKFSYALVRDDRSTVDSTGVSSPDPHNSSTRHHFIYDSIPLSANLGLKIDATLISKDGNDPKAHGGWALTGELVQDKVLGGTNAIVLQYGVGAAARAGKFGQVGNVTDDSKVKRTRLIDLLRWQSTPEFGGEAYVLWQRDTLPAGHDTWTSFGVRPVYALSENFKLEFEATHGRVSLASGGDSQQLTKFTVAPTISSGKGYWARPDLRFFVTYAKWNDAAKKAGVAGGSTGVFGNSTNGTTYGVQVEAWW